MTDDHIQIDDARIRSAVAGLQELIREHYPAAEFRVAQGEDPPGTYITAVVDVADTDLVTDLVIDRLLEIQIDEGLPVYVVPTRPPERIAELVHSTRKANRLAP